MHEFLGDLDPKKHVYRNSLFGELNNQLILNEKKFKSSLDQQKRLEVNIESINLWNKFSIDSEKSLPSVILN